MNRALRRRQEKQARHSGQAGPALRRAMQLHSAGRLAEAERAYRRILQTDAANVGAVHLLGVLLSQRGDHARGAELIQRSIRAHPRPPPSYHFNLGKALEGQGAFTDAATAYRRTLESEPDNAEALNNLGNVLFTAGEADAAFDAYRRALAADPRAPAPRRNLCEHLLRAGRLDEAGEVVRTALSLDSRAADIHAILGRIAAAQGRRGDAIAAFRESLDLDPADPFNAAMELAALDAADVPARAPAAFIRRHYGERAATWDHTAYSKTYRGHDLIVDAVAAALGDAKGLAVLDLGCGTGELGRRLKPRAARLDGVDLSRAMITVAGQKGIYDRLAAADLLAFLRQRMDQPGAEISSPLAGEGQGGGKAASGVATYDLVVAGAVLIHFKNLRPVFESVRQTLNPGGLLIFTVFAAGANQALSDFTCHTHDRAQVIQAAQESGLTVVSVDEATHETHQGNPVPCLVVTLRA